MGCRSRSSSADIRIDGRELAAERIDGVLEEAEEVAGTGRAVRPVDADDPNVFCGSI